MFSGIIEASVPIEKFAVGEKSLRIEVRRPGSFDDIKTGDSIAVNGVCLTVETFSADRMTFTLGFETLQVLGFRPDDIENPDFSLRKKAMNVERSLRFGDRMHGHFVTGHVDTLAQVTFKENVGESLILRLQVPDSQGNVLWKKGSVTLNGVSLTLNQVEKKGDHVEFEVCLIPETLTRTNLSQYAVGEKINVEFDWMAKGLMQAMQNRWPEVGP